MVWTMASKKWNIQEAIEDMRVRLLDGDDGVAIAAAGLGLGLLGADLAYRFAGTDVKIALPKLVPGTDVKAWLGLFTDFWGSILPQIDIDVGAGLWDWKFTAMAFGLVMAGISMYIMNHPELILAAMDWVKDIQREALDVLEAVTINTSENAEQAAKLLSGQGLLPGG